MGEPVRTGDLGGLDRRADLRSRGQAGMTMVETLLAMALSVMVFLPIIGWAQFALREETATQQRSVTSSGLGILRLTMLRDVSSSDVAVTSGPAMVDCGGGEGSGGTVLFVLVRDEQRIVYSRAPGADVGTSLWRRLCSSPGGSIVDSTELVTGILPGATTAECRTAGPGEGTCRRVNLRLTTTDFRTASVTATVRTDGAATSTGAGSSVLAPVVALSADPVSGKRGMTVSFSSEGSTSLIGGDLSYFWEFGDGTTSTEANPTKRFDQVGEFTTVLTVTDAAGTPSTDFVVIEVTNSLPEAVIAAPAPGTKVYRGQVLNFSSAGSNDAGDAPYGGHIVSYLWEFGDGTSSTDPNPAKAFTTLSPTSGFTVRLTVTDDSGATNQDQVKVIVENRLPSVKIVANPPAGSPPLTVALSAQVTDETSMATNPPVTYAWKLGNGSTSSAANPTVTYPTSGSRTVELTITDDAGETASDTFKIEVTRLPTASFNISPSSGRANLSVSFTNTTSDPDNNAVSWLWDFGNGTTSTSKNPGSKTYGVDNPNSDTFTGATYTARLTVTDRFGGTSTATRTITVNGAPAPGGLKATRSGNKVTYRWNSVTGVNGYQLNIDFTSGRCSDRTVTVTSTSTAIDYGSGGGNCAKATQNLKVRARDTSTGKWGSWSSNVKFN